MRNIRSLLMALACLVLLISSCRPSMGISTTLARKLPPNESNLPIVVFQAPSDQIPDERVLVGSVKAYNTQQSPSDNDSAYVIDLAKAEARKSGGNALVINELRKPSKWYTRTRVKADIIMAKDIVVPELPDSLPALVIAYKKKEFKKQKRIRDKGTIDMHISYPFLGASRIRPVSDVFQTEHDIFGIGVGLEYYYHKKRSVSLGLSGKWGASDDDELSIMDFELMHRHWIKKLVVGYGISLTHNSLSRSHWESAGDEAHSVFHRYKFDYWNAGLAASAHWMFTESFGAGFKYYPTFFCTNTRKIRFEHTFGIDISWRFHIFSKKRTKM